MRLAAAASWLHKWLALIVGVQVLLWIVSGLFFAVYPIERVRSEHRIAAHAAAPLDAEVMEGSAAVAALLPATPTKLSYERDATGRVVAIAEYARGRPTLVDVQAGRVTSPLTAEAAVEIARAAIAGAPGVRDDARERGVSGVSRAAAGLAHRPGGR